MDEVMALALLTCEARNTTRRPANTKAQPRVPVGVAPKQSVSEQLVARSGEEIGRLQVLRELPCVAALRGVDGVVIPLNAAGRPWRFCLPAHDRLSASSMIAP